MFVHLHNHSHYSILEGLPKPWEYAKKAKELGMSAVAITDTSNMHGAHELYLSCRSEWITPILGTEIFIESSLDPNLKHKLVLLAKNLSGYRNIINLISKANLENPWTQAYITCEDIEALKIEKKDLEIVCLSGDITGEISYYILTGQTEEKILKRIQFYSDLFWKENYYLELLYHDDIPKQNFITDTIINLHKKHHLPVVAANNCYYISETDKKTQDIIMALWTGHELENPDRKTLINGDYSFKTEEEMEILFGFIPSALSNTGKIADMVSIEIETGGILIPKFELPEADQKIYQKALAFQKSGNNLKILSSDEWYLRYLSFAGLNWRYDDVDIPEDILFTLVQKLDKKALEKKLTETSPQELKDLSLTYYSEEKKKILSKFSEDLQEKIERLEYELVVVHEMWFDAYFLIVADYINWARKENIPVWPGRWSAAGSLMAFTSGITDIDPLTYGLIFERFLNPARITMPDIDTDFADSERDRVVAYCREKYGADRVAQICTFGTFAARAAVKDVGRVMGIHFSEMNELAKMIPEKPGTKLTWALEDSVEFKEAYENNEKYKDIIDNALKIEGNVRQLWVHACAVIIAPLPITNFTALQHPPKDAEGIITQLSAYPLEDLWLLKMDFLWLRNLTIIKRCLKIIKNNGWDDIDMLNIPLNAPEVFEIFGAWATSWVFQFESDGMRKYLSDLQPNTFEDLIAMVSLYRPWPLAYIPNYINRKHGKEEIAYMTEDLIEILKTEKVTDEEIESQRIMLEDDLRKILDVTYWIAVYQEQLMFIVQYMAWFSLWEADLLRRWVWKKKVEVVEALKIEFIEKAKNFRGYHEKVSRYIYEEMIQPAANYSFNKSHAACYALISYQTAYLKAFHRAEFLTALMVSDEQNMERIVMEVNECEQVWISVLPPSINESMKHFTFIDKKTIRFWLKAIKWIGDGPIDKIISARADWGEYKDIENFIERVWKEVINKKSLEALSLSWAMDEIWDRAQIYSSIEDMIKYVKRSEKMQETKQIWLFDLGWDAWDFSDKLQLKDNVKKMSFEEKLSWEKQMIGFPVSGHPLDGLKRYVEKRSINTKKLKTDFETLEKLEAKKQEENKKQPETKWDTTENCQSVGVITDVRKITTKAGKLMVFLKCESFDYDFEVVIFPKDVEKYGNIVEEDKIIIVSGNLNINFEYKRKSIQARDIKIATITQVRDQARDLDLFDNSKSRASKWTEDETEEFDKKLEEKIESHTWEPEEQIQASKYTVSVPKHASRSDLENLKIFLSQEPKWSCAIYIDIWGKQAPTKMSIQNTFSLKNREKNTWN
jgi:DNA polymerase III subunit alpha